MAQPMHQKAHPPVDFSQSALAVQVVAVLRPIPVTGSPGNDVDDTGTFDGAELMQFRGQCRVACGSHVKSAARQARRAVIFVVDNGCRLHKGFLAADDTARRAAQKEKPDRERDAWK
jgi:hypothetical protein